MTNRTISSALCTLLALIAMLAPATASLAVEEIEVKYRAPNEQDHVVLWDAEDNISISEPGEWGGGVTEWSAQVRALSARTTTSIGKINVSGDQNDDITLYVMYDISIQTMASYALNDCEGIWLNSDSDLTIVAYTYGDLTGNIFQSNSQYRPIKDVRFLCAGSIAADITIKAINVNQILAHKIEGGVTIESVAGTGAAIYTVAVGYSSGARSGLPPPDGGWPTMSEMDIGTSGSPLTLRTPSGVDITGTVASLDDLYVHLEVGGWTGQLRNALIYGADFGYSSGTLTHRMQITGETVRLGGVYACSDSGGYLDTASDYFYITSTTSDYEAKIASLSDGMNGSYDEVDFRGRFWFNAGIAASAYMRLSDDMDGELIFNALNDERPWHPSSHVLIDGANITEENPAYSLVTTGGGTVGMVDGVGNDLGFHLHLEACDPPSGSEISLAHWKSNGDPVTPIYLVFYGPIRLEGDGPHVDLQWFDPAKRGVGHRRHLRLLKSRSASLRLASQRREHLAQRAGTHEVPHLPLRDAAG